MLGALTLFTVAIVFVIIAIGLPSSKSTRANVFLGSATVFAILFFAIVIAVALMVPKFLPFLGMMKGLGKMVHDEEGKIEAAVRSALPEAKKALSDVVHEVAPRAEAMAATLRRKATAAYDAAANTA